MSTSIYIYILAVTIHPEKKKKKKKHTLLPGFAVFLLAPTLAPIKNAGVATTAWAWQGLKGEVITPLVFRDSNEQ